jgi:hypothetical protein
VQESRVCFASILLYSSRPVTVAFAYGPEVVLNIVRYLRYPQSDLSAALDRITSMRPGIDRDV